MKLIGAICLFAIATFTITHTGNDYYSQAFRSCCRNNTCVAISTQAQLPHKTLLLSRTPCAQSFILLILVFTAPTHFDKRKAIRRTWGTDSSLKPRWKTVFLVGKTTKKQDSEYLEAESTMYFDMVRSAHDDNYDTLSLKLEMGLEWASRYCQFDYLLKADDDVFVDPLRVIDILQDASTPKVKLYMGYVARNWSPLRRGKYAVSKDEYEKKKYPDFCIGAAYLLSKDLVDRFVEFFGVERRVNLEDVYVGILADKVNANAVGHPGFYMWKDGPCNFYSDMLIYNRATVGCHETLHEETSKERMKQELARLSTLGIEANQTLV